MLTLGAEWICAVGHRLNRFTGVKDIDKEHKMKNKMIAFATITGCLLVFTGCMSLKGNVPFQYQPSLISSSKKIDKSVGFNIANDARPEKQVKALEKTIKDIPNKLTYKMMEDFKASSIFREVNFPPQDSDDIVINSTINQFSWRVNTNWFAVIFYLMYFGMPVEEHVGNVDVSLEIVDNKSGKVLGTIRGSGEQKLSYSLYNMSVGEAGSELAEAFRLTVKDLKEKILTEINIQ